MSRSVLAMFIVLMGSSIDCRPENSFLDGLVKRSSSSSMDQDLKANVNDLVRQKREDAIPVCPEESGSQSGVSESEIDLGVLYDKKDCFDQCREKGGNGVSMHTMTLQCICKIGMTGVEAASFWRSCYISDPKEPEQTPEPEAIPADRIECLTNGKGMSVTLESSDLTAYPDRADLLLGNCPFESDGSIEGGVDDCGIEKKIVDETVIYSTKVISKQEEKPITRRKPVSVSVSCTFCCTTINQKASSSFNPGLTNVEGETHVEAPDNNFKLELTLLDKDGKPIESGAVVAIPIGEKVTASITGAPEHMKVRADNCWATPKEDTEEKTYKLLENSCAADASFRKTVDGTGEKITFDSFAFSHDIGSSVYLHCDLVACHEGEECGKCKQGRRRRAVADAGAVTTAAAITTKFEVFFE